MSLDSGGMSLRVGEHDIQGRHQGDDPPPPPSEGPRASPVPVATDNQLLRFAEEKRLAVAPGLNPARRQELGQFLTPLPVAAFLASLFDMSGGYPGGATLLDPGAGVGSLSAAFVDRWLREAGHPPLAITAVEIDPALHPPLSSTLRACGQIPAVSGSIVPHDFVEWATDQLGAWWGSETTFDFVIMNPPYHKIGTASRERRLLAGLGIEVSNIYAAFLALAFRLLRDGGQLVAITPRSFTNGPYFRSFRHDLLKHMTFRQIHVYDSRTSAFADGDVLQENVIFHAIKAKILSPVTISSNGGPDDEFMTLRVVPHHLVVRDDDPEAFIHLATDGVSADISHRMAQLPATLEETGISVSTGRVVDFRARQHLRADPDTDCSPLVYPNHFHHGKVRWPIPGGRKCNAIDFNPETAPLVLPNGPFALVKRFSAKEERRRVVAVVSEPRDVPGPWIGFENHVNVFHEDNRPLSHAVARGLAAFLNSTIVDLFFRQWSGHTQVNATDLRSLRYPTIKQLTSLGEAIGDKEISTVLADELLPIHVPELGCAEGVDPLMAHQKIGEALDVLRELGLPRAQLNERSALTLLALVNLTPDKSWEDIEAPLMGITPIMEFIAAHYGRTYAPNTRETVRRQTIHQFMSAGLVERNPDDPLRSVNSPWTVYKVPAAVIDFLKCVQTDQWARRLPEFRQMLPSLVAKWARERAMNLIPVILPSGQEVVLSPGGQNPLVKQIIEVFCPRFTPGGEVLYVGDTGDKWGVFEAGRLAEIGVVVDEHGKMPDIVILDSERNWLVLIEAVTSHGPMDAKRREELGSLFAGASVGIVYVTAFMDRKTLATYLAEISWETEVWIAETPTHMIHFDGVRFLGPYDF
jgi:adenine-specific DNA-methyltransferase